jgi:hypothetical protein
MGCVDPLSEDQVVKPGVGDLVLDAQTGLVVAWRRRQAHPEVWARTVKAA